VLHPLQITIAKFIFRLLLPLERFNKPHMKYSVTKLPQMEDRYIMEIKEGEQK